MVFVSAAGWVLSAAAQTRHTPAAASAGTIANIRIEGIQRIEPETIRSYLLVQPGDPWDPERIDRSLKALFNTGLFADVQLDREGNVLVVRLVEHEVHKIGKVGVNIGRKDLPREAVLPLLTVQSGDWYDAQELEHSISVLTDALGNRGYAFVEVKPEVNRYREEHTVDVVFDVHEGPQVYVERIDISGNVRTLDKVIRREFLLVEGDAFNTNKMQRSKDRVKNLGFFKKVEVSNSPGSAPDRTVINTEIEEQSTGELSVGLGFSTTDGPLADVSIRERNFLGRGQDVRIGTVISFRSQQVDLSFTEPYFLDKNIAAGIDIFEVKTSPTSNFFSGISPVYQQFSYGGALRAGYQISENVRQTFKYTARSDDITNIQSDASLFIQLQAGTHLTSAIGQVLLYDRRDNRQEPTSGYYPDRKRQ